MASCSSSSFFFGEFFWIFFFYFQFRFSQVHFWPKRAGYLVHFIDLRYFIVGDVDHVAKSSLANANCQLPGSCWSHSLGLRLRLGLEVRKKTQVMQPLHLPFAAYLECLFDLAGQRPYPAIFLVFLRLPQGLAGIPQ